MSEKSFLLTLQSGKGWKTSLCRKEEKHKMKWNEATLMLWGLQAPTTQGWQNVESEYLLWMYIMQSYYFCLHESSCALKYLLLAGWFPTSHLFSSRDCEVEANLHLESISKEWHWIFLQVLLLNCAVLQCWVSLTVL